MKGRELMKKQSNIIFSIILLLTLAVGMLSGCSGNKDYSNIVENPNISIPGYESLDFTAGKKKQSVDFYNPDENTCYFRISLVVEEETLWTSELLVPGEHIKSIKLDRELESGDYPATLKYECFSLKDETPLNGSDIELTLIVR